MLSHLDLTQLQKALWTDTAADQGIGTISCGEFTDEELRDAVTRLHERGYADIETDRLPLTVINQLRTLVAHLWENEGDAMSVTAQYLDSVNVPPPGLFAEIWAPVGLRYHALHHLVPSVPYHGLAEAHRRLHAAFGDQSTYGGAHYRGMLPLLGKIGRSTMRVR